MDKFVNLHGHSNFSLLDGMTRINELVDRTLEIGQPASCITDHGVMYSLVDHLQYAKKKEQKPIVGFEAYVVKNHKIKDKSEAQRESETKREHLVLLAKNYKGYQSISKMCSVGATDGFYYRPRIDDNVIKTLGTDGVIGMSACLAGRIAQRILKDDIEGAEEWAKYYYKLFNGDFYLEIQPTIEDDQIKINKGLIEIHKKLGIPIVATTDFHYLNHNDAETHDVLLAIQSRSLVSDPDRWQFPGDTFYVMSREEILQSFKRNGHEVLDQSIVELAVNTTVDIANQCDVSINFGKHYLPQIEPPKNNNEFSEWANQKPDGLSSENYLRYLCIKGLKDKGKTSQEYRERLDYELGIINQMGFPDYFLIMADIMDFCRNNNVPYGPARGSGGGSLVSYATGITKIDPLKYDLLFERFLNPERGKLPDIDSDFCVKKGHKVFEYLNEKYGKDRCCNIATFGRLQMKAVLKDIARALDISYDEVNAYTRGINSREFNSVEELMQSPEYSGFLKKYPELYKHARKLEGSPRHVSQHPAGICVLPLPVTDLFPVQNAKETHEDSDVGYLSQFEKDQTEMLGGVKLDILKLKNVTEIDEMLNEINETYNLNLSDEDIPLNDDKTWDLIGRGDTLGVFQFASPIGINVLKQIKPRNLEELSAANAFIRPGSSGLEEYLAAKKNPSKIRKLDPRLDQYLKSTYGAIVYQEQIMYMISELMGISFGEADLYRRALEKPAKDKKNYVGKFNNEVVKIATERGFDPEIAEIVKNLILDNIGYGFNKSHSIAYSLISYQTAWLKANYPLVFYTTMFNGNLDNLPDFMAESKRNGITVLSPHVSYSKYNSIIESEDDRSIRIGLNAVKGIGPKAVESIIEDQPYISINDFMDRTNGRSVNKKVIEAIIKSGSFGKLGIHIEEDDLDEDLRLEFEYKVIDNVKYILLNRNQQEFWYDTYNNMTRKKSIPNYLIPTTLIKGKYLDQYDFVIEDEDAIVIPQNRLEELELKLEEVKQFRTRKRPKGELKKKKKKKKVSPLRRPFVEFGNELAEIKMDTLELYLREVKQLGFSFLEHPLEQHLDKIDLYDDKQDGELMMTAGIITGMQERKTRNNKPFYWVFLQTPRDVVRITMWDNQFKQNHKIIKKNKLIAVRGVKGYGGMNVDDIKEINL
ncbi:MAG: DNA polymerase III subunit alpha [archaeon]